MVSGPAGMDASLTSVIFFICSDPLRKSHGLGPTSRLSSLLGIVGPRGALRHDLGPAICCLWWVWTHFPYGLNKNIGLSFYLSCISGYLSLLGLPALCWSSRSDSHTAPSTGKWFSCHHLPQPSNTYILPTSPWCPKRQLCLHFAHFPKVASGSLTIFKHKLLSEGLKPLTITCIVWGFFTFWAHVDPSCGSPTRGQHITANTSPPTFHAGGQNKRKKAVQSASNYFSTTSRSHWISNDGRRHLLCHPGHPWVCRTC